MPSAAESTSLLKKSPWHIAESAKDRMLESVLTSNRAFRTAR